MRHVSTNSDFSRTYTVGPDGNPLRPYSLYNYGPLNYYQRPEERWQADVFRTTTSTTRRRCTAEFMFMDDNTVGQIAPSGVFGVYYDDHCDDNPTCCSRTARMVQQMCIAGESDYATPRSSIQRRNVEGGGRQDDIGLTDYRGVSVSRASCSSTGTTTCRPVRHGDLYTETYNNDISITRIGVARWTWSTDLDPASALRQSVRRRRGPGLRAVEHLAARAA